MTIIEGTKETSTLPTKSSPSVMGVAKSASIVLLSFSPAKLSEDITLEAIRGITRNRGAKK